MIVLFNIQCPVRSRLLGYSTMKDSGLSSSEVLYLLKSIMDHSPDGCDVVLGYVFIYYDNIAAAE